jgi:uncharacterized protein (TIGR00266 family)
MPSFGYIDVDLSPGESIFSESGAMTSMSSDLDLKAKMNGSFFSAFFKRFLGDESFFIEQFTNNTEGVRRLTLTQDTPGQVLEMELNDNSICMQPGAYLASTEGVNLGIKWAGIASFIAREGLFKLVASGKGKLYFGAYGGLIEHQVNGEFIVDTGHLVAYDPNITLHLQLAGGIFSSFFSGEGIVTRLVGNGRIFLQSRSLNGLTDWINPKLW